MIRKARLIDKEMMSILTRVAEAVGADDVARERGHGKDARVRRVQRLLLLGEEKGVGGK